MAGSNGKVVLAYSGGLDTSVCIRYLQTLHKLDVITVTVDCGQDDDFKAIESKAKSIGAHLHCDMSFALSSYGKKAKQEGLDLRVYTINGYKKH